MFTEEGASPPYYVTKTNFRGRVSLASCHAAIGFGPCGSQVLAMANPNHHVDAELHSLSSERRPRRCLTATQACQVPRKRARGRWMRGSGGIERTGSETLGFGVIILVQGSIH